MASPLRYPKEKNKVLSEDFRPSDNFFQSDLIFKHYLKANSSSQGFTFISKKLEVLGKEAAGVMNDLSLLADKYGPQLIKRNSIGETINEIRFHPAYWELMGIAVKSDMFRVKWEPSLQEKFHGEKQLLGFSSAYLFAMSECGQFCPLCMTDGVARIIDLFCLEEDKERLLSHIFTENAEEFFTGAMYLTEKSGGSDVGANLAMATPAGGNKYLLNGEKWFCSNANADIIFALARTDPAIEGTKGLSIFLIEKLLPNGRRNPIDIIRLKDKLGVRSMATAECFFTDTVGKLVGQEFEGLKVMLEMINISRIYNAVAALSGSRRALIEAYQFLCHRRTFGKTAIEHPLVRTKLTELASLHTANFYLVWRTIKSLELSDAGNNREKQLLRLLNPMAKKWSAETGVFITRESMELMGGLGYIEETVMPKLMRDILVLPIWEGSGNIILLDMLRALTKTRGFDIICQEINHSAAGLSPHSRWMKEELKKLIDFSEKIKKYSQDDMEASAKPFFENLTRLYQISLLMDNLNEVSQKWILPAIDYLKERYLASPNTKVKTLSLAEVKDLVAWQF